MDRDIREMLSAKTASEDSHVEAGSTQGGVLHAEEARKV